MARIDQTVSAVGVVRADLVADVADNLLDTVIGCSINSAGKLVLGAAGQTGFVGICIPKKNENKAGMRTDIFKLGQVVDLVGLAAGTKYYLAADGTLSATATAGRVYAGYTVEADRLVLSGFAGEVAV